jgi:hypothetical protein
MNQPLQQHAAQAAIVSLPANATCKVRGVDEQRLVCIAEESPVFFAITDSPTP